MFSCQLSYDFSPVLSIIYNFWNDDVSMSSAISSVKLACPALCFLFFPTLASLLFIATLTEYHFLPHIPVTQVKFTAFPAVLAETQTSLPSIFETMLPEAIVSLTAFISISFTYLEPIHINLATAQNMETRIEDSDKIITGCRSLLQHCGRPRYLESIWVL